tara:strand:- start:448 stop:1179 length:732 start_codon:yes stop_codon:yes gene_type:complete
MRYMGSKARHAKQIVPILMDGHDQTKPYIEPFLGGGNMMANVAADIRIGGDVAKYAVALLRAVAAGWVPPSEVSEELYRDVKSRKENYPPELVGFVGYCCTYGAKFFAGYARRKTTIGARVRNDADEQCRALIKQAKGLRDVQFYVGEYDEINYPVGSTVYMDPPYAGTKKYNSGDFDHDRFWRFCASLSATCRVFVSEYTAPPNWLPVWEKEVTSSLTKDTGSLRATEKLFTINTHLKEPMT